MDGATALTLILITVGAVVMPALARAFRIPVAVVEILYGVLIGTSGLGWVEDGGPFVTGLSELGFAFFLFLAGLEIDFRGVEKRGKRQWTLPFVVCVLAGILAYSASAWLGWGLWLALAVGATAVPLLLSVVREAGLAGTPLGTTMVSVAAMGEVLTIVALSAVEVFDGAHGDVSHMVIGVGRVAGFAFIVLLAAVVLRALLWWVPEVFQRLVQRDDPAEVGVRVGFALMLVFVGLSYLAGVEPFLGAFVAGAVLGFVVREAGVLEHKLASMAYGFFVPMFFVHVGIRLHVSVELFVDNAAFVATFLVVMLGVKLLPGVLLFSRGLSVREVIATSALLAAPLTLVIAIMDLGARAGAVDRQTEAVVIGAGILASLVFPTLARALVVRGADGNVQKTSRPRS